MAERIILDPTEIAGSTRTQIDITDWIDQEGVDWGEAAIDAFMADRARGAIPVDYTVPNREITSGLKLVTKGGTTAITARSNIQAKIALFQKEGGWIKRVTNSGGTVYADVVDAAFTATSVSGWESRQDVDIDASFRLTCVPDFYEDERTLSDHTETSLPELVFNEEDIVGDYPARVRIVVDEDDAEDQRGLVWGFRSRHYSSALSAKLAFSAENLTPLDTAAVASISGAHGGDVVRHGTLSTSWTPVLGTNRGGTEYLTHTGTYRLYARVYSTSGTTVQTRFVWDVGDLVNPAENDAWRLPGASNFYVHDFGEVRLDPAPVGTHRWQGQFQAKGDAGGENFSVDRVWMVPVDEGMGVLTAPVNFSEGLASYSARSEFTTESGAITGDSLAVGGTWTGAGDADDFSVGSGVATRSVTNDSALLQNGRLITASTPTLTNCIVRVDGQATSASITADANGDGPARSGVLARYSATTDFVTAYWSLEPTGLVIRMYKRLSSTNTLLNTRTYPGNGTGATYSIALQIDSTGRYWVFWTPVGGQWQLAFGGTDSNFATGTLSSGKVGVYDQCAGGGTNVRTYDNFAAWVPNPDAVLFASRSIQLTTDGHYRLDSGGTAYGPVSVPAGDLPRLPVAGLEDRTTEVFIKGSRGDFDELPDSGIDDISARVYYRPSWLHVPNT